MDTNFHEFGSVIIVTSSGKKILPFKPVKHQVTILTDIPDWARSTVERLESFGWTVEWIDIRSFDWNPLEPLPGWNLLFNRIAARPAGDDPALFTKARDLLAAVQAADIPCLNGARCHAIGASKSLQANLLAECGVPTPWTQSVSSIDWKVKLAKVDPEKPLLIKPNAGGRGRGISSPEDVGPETFVPDGFAVLQEEIKSGDGRIHRVEVMGGEVLYEASVPLEAETFDYCLAGADRSVLTFTTEPSAEVAAYCEQVADAASLDLGSIEYLIDEGGNPWFIDINPVSSFVPDVGQRLGRDPFEKITDLLRGLLEK